MKPIEYLRRRCKFRRPSLARRITVYFILFGLLVFTATALLYIRSSEKHFTRVTAQLIRNQVMQLEGSSEPDFIWHSVGGPLPGLTDLTRMLTNFSAIFYSVSDIALYARSSANGPWHLLYLDESGTLRKRAAADDSLSKLKFQGRSSRRGRVRLQRNTRSVLQRRHLFDVCRHHRQARCPPIRCPADGVPRGAWRYGSAPTIIIQLLFSSCFADCAVCRVLFRTPDLPAR
jgi:hypothetical protein